MVFVHKKPLAYQDVQGDIKVDSSLPKTTYLFRVEANQSTVSLQRLEKYTFIITEKPDAANRIANALDRAGKPKSLAHNGVPYYEAQRDRKLLIVPALGHLYTVAADKKKPRQFPVLDYDWVPLYLAEKGASRLRIWLQAIADLAKGADDFVDACDYDIEGSIIGYCILRYACGGKETEAKRMKYSTLTAEELEKSYQSMLPSLDFPLIEAGLARHEVDWLYGINLSRALTLAAKKASNQYTTLSTGRVQGPTLKFLALRERNINCFVPTPYWTLKTRFSVDGKVLEAEHEKKAFEVKSEAEATAKRCKVKTGTAESVEKKQFRQPPPFPFDLGALQSEAYRFFSYTPIHTLAAAQRLYLEALISYPRTSSQRLPPEIGYARILRGLAKNRAFLQAAGELLSRTELKPNEGKKADSAHPAIYPTGKLPIKALAGAEKNIYELVVRRFFAVFGDPALRQTAKITLDLGGEKFLLVGTQTLEVGWLSLYEPFGRLRDTSLPLIKEGDSVAIKRIALEDRFTKPPVRYNPSSVVRKMERCNIGTKATRAGILQTLYNRKYVRDEKIAVTDLGFEVTNVLREYCPSIVSVEFTRDLEEKMEHIQEGKGKKTEVITQAVGALKPVIANLQLNEPAVGQKLVRAVNQANLEERIIGPCPTCHAGSLIIQYSKKTGKLFVGCTNYFKSACKTVFPLPQRGYIWPTARPCKECGWNTVQVWPKRGRPWNLCPNPSCPSKRNGETN